MAQWPQDGLSGYFFVNLFCALAYVAEVLFKWNQTGAKHYFWDGEVKKWNVTDFILTIISVLEVAGMASRGFMPESVIEHVLQPLTLLRWIRLIRIIHLLEDIPALTVTIGGVMGSMEPLVWIVVALLFSNYVFAIFFHLVVTPCPDDHSADPA